MQCYTYVIFDVALKTLKLVSKVTYTVIVNASGVTKHVAQA
jgi:hypothetical protein